MANNARKQFDANIRDIHLLLDHYWRDEYFEKAGISSIPQHADVLFRSATVLLVSHWEAYVEDICDEALHLMIHHVKSSDALPKAIKKHIAKELKDSLNDLDIWKIADAGWRSLLRSRLGEMRDLRNRQFNSPKAAQVADFIERTIGLSKIQDAWRVDDFTAKESADLLDRLVEVRGQIAHRGRVSVKIDKAWVEGMLDLIRSLASKTGGSVNRHVKRLTGESLW